MMSLKPGETIYKPGDWEKAVKTGSIPTKPGVLTALFLLHAIDFL